MAEEIDQSLAELVCANAGNYIQAGHDAEKTLESLFFAAVCMSRHYMSNQDTASYLRQLADEMEKAPDLQPGRLH